MKKDLKYYKSLNYPITIQTYTEDGEIHYSLEIPDLPGCGAEARNLDEAMKRLNEAKELWIEVSLKRNLPIAEPVSEKEFSGKFILRLDPRLHMELRKRSEKSNMSLNQYIKTLIENQISNSELIKQLKDLKEEFTNKMSKLLKESDLLKRKIVDIEDNIQNLKDTKSWKIIQVHSPEMDNSWLEIKNIERANFSNLSFGSNSNQLQYTCDIKWN